MSLSEREKEQIGALSYGLGDKPVATVEEFLREFRGGTADRNNLAGELLSEALSSQQSEDVELALLVGYSLGFTVSHINVLASLAQADWHHSHEGIALALDEIRTPACVNTLYQLAQWVPEYLEFDEARALGSKAVWALSKIGDMSAKNALQQIAQSQHDNIGKLAQEKLLELG